MATDTQLRSVETALSQKSVWQEVLVISTSLFMYGLTYAVPIPETPSRNRRLFDQDACSFSSGTLLETTPYAVVSTATATSIYEEDFSDNYIAKAPVVKEFEVLISSFKIDRSLPKLFAE